MTRFASPVSALIICMNEADMIGPCLESIDFCAEIIIVDSGSTDGTVACVESYIAKGYPITLLHNDWPGFPVSGNSRSTTPTSPGVSPSIRTSASTTGCGNRSWPSRRRPTTRSAVGTSAAATG
ncbi:glycosyltransferase [Mesorhizobium sp. ORM6]